MTTTAIDLFAGAGGFSTGAERAGARVLWAANHWPEAVACHVANHPTVTHACQDLGEADWTAVPASDLLLASPACQGFSQAAQPARAGAGGSHRPDRALATAKGQRDRNTAWAVLAAADTVRPRSIVVENVVDMADRWPVFPAWCGVLESMGYAVRTHRLWAHMYGGGQERQRLVVTASIDGPIDLAESYGMRENGPRIGDLLEPHDAPGNLWRPIDSKSDRMRERIAKAQREAGETCFWANVSESRGRALDERFPTATTKSGSQWCLIDGDRIRVLNTREIARSMSFPDDYKLPANRDLAGKLVGNAIDVRFAEGIVSQVLAATHTYH